MNVGACVENSGNDANEGERDGQSGERIICLLFLSLFSESDLVLLLHDALEFEKSGHVQCEE